MTEEVPITMDGSLVRSKIVATVGPASRSRLDELARAGADVFRLNTAHGQESDHAEIVDRIRALERELDRPLAILVDLAGPKIRIGQLKKDPLFLHRGDKLRLVSADRVAEERDIPVSLPQILDDLAVGHRVLFADGTIRVRVIEKSAGGVIAEVESGGELRSKQGINVPEASLNVATITERDRYYARWAVRHGADYISQSFVRTAADMQALRDLVKQACQEHAADPLACPGLIAKIEKREALQELAKIVQASDGIMVARGDLGVEVDVAETPVIQKRILAVCRRYGRPAIVATQMLDSMQRHARPTRAEATDVANAVLDGADACMLSGETAIGEYPVESVRVMDRILRHTETILPERDGSQQDAQIGIDVHRVTAAIVAGCAVVARESGAALVGVITNSGATARALSRRRIPLPILGGSTRLPTARRMCLYWGVEPVWLDTHEHHGEAEQRLIEKAQAIRTVAPGERAVFVTGSGVPGRPHNTIVVHEVTTDDVHA